MRIRSAIWWLVVLSSLPLACVAIDGEDVETVAQPTIYGTRDTQERFEATGPVADPLFDAEVMLVSERARYVQSSSGGYAISGAPTLSQYIASAYGYPMCTTEPYRSEPTPGFCSGFMVGPDLIATAGHCVRNSRDCRDTTFVFGYNVPASSGGAVTWVPGDNVYQCASIVGRVETSTEDWAVLRTDRPIAGHQALPVRRTGTIALGTPLAVIGHPTGLPTKFADNAVVQANGSSLYFEANIDVFAGNSGSGVVSWDGTGQPTIEGILVRGNADWTYGSQSGQTCVQAVTCADSGCTGSAGSGWEEVTRATLFDHLIPAPAVCGDNVCQPSEDCASCSADCGACPVCGDGTCDPDESCESCSTDCGECPVCQPRNAACSSSDECCAGLSCHPRKHTCR